MALLLQLLVLLNCRDHYNHDENVLFKECSCNLNCKV